MLTAGEVGLGQEVKRTRLKARSCFLRAETPHICSGIPKRWQLRYDTHPRSQRLRQECTGSPPVEEKARVEDICWESQLWRSDLHPSRPAARSLWLRREAGIPVAEKLGPTQYLARV